MCRARGVPPGGTCHAVTRYRPTGTSTIFEYVSVRAAPERAVNALPALPSTSAPTGVTVNSTFSLSWKSAIGSVSRSTAPP
jgi:hypothetical protein